ncbi:MAG: hypothetical protein PWQ91_326 [Eubacteriales bacterium]|nr:hypothetical protein [Eubacteriales bacterium]MDN5363265.1 hypothetical protein [Eubacteriales bacterium]
MNKYKVKIIPENIEVQVEENKTLMEVFAENGIEFDFPCGGVGKCKKCKVKIIGKDGAEEEVLACSTKVKGDLIVDTSKKEQKHLILIEGVSRQIKANPSIKKVYVELPNPTLEDHRSDWTRLKESLGYKDGRTSLGLLQELPKKLRGSNFKITAVVVGDEVLGVESGDTSDKLLGMAVDIGTTTIVGYLMDLNTGQELTHVSSLNPQTKYGADVVTRITFASHEKDGLLKLHEEVINEINDLIVKATKQVGYKPEDIYALTIVGNTTMHHLFLKIHPEYVAKAPYVPVVKEPVIVDAKELKITINEVGKVFVLPNIAGFVGADTVGAALAAEMDRGDKLRLLIDIGTNGEIVLGTAERLLACSTAAGPAFEGARITCGMRGAEGAIDHVYLGEEYKYTVIGGDLPRGICGSGLLDVIAGLLEVGIIDRNGKLLPPDQITNELGKKYRDRIVQQDGSWSFVLEENTATGQPVYITQKDIRELQLAKGAIAAGIEILLEAYGAKVEDISEVLLAGAFGNYLTPRSACKIGLIPPELESKIKGIGNAAGVGAKIALLSAEEYQRAVELSQQIQYIELCAVKEFPEVFAKKLKF